MAVELGGETGEAQGLVLIRSNGSPLSFEGTDLDAHHCTFLFRSQGDKNLQLLKPSDTYTVCVAGIYS